MIHEAAPKPVRGLPLRGLPLSGWLVFLVVANVWTVYRYAMIIYDLVDHYVFTGTSQWAFPLLGLLAVVNIVGVMLLWFGRKLGFYLLVATSLIAFVVNTLLNVPITATLLGLLGLLILWALLRPRWSDFR